VPALAGNVARANAASVEGLLGAGANIFGKTNVPYLIGDWQTFNAIYGTTNNPWDLARGPGGSSGGSAAALAAGLSALEAGSDIGASIRNPAHYCGVYGHKPSFGAVPQQGHAIPGAEAPIDILVLGPLARSADDLELALDAMAGPEPADRGAWSLTLPGAKKQRLSEFRIALVSGDANSKVDSAVTDRLQAAAAAVAKAGARVDDRPRLPVDTARAHALYLQLLRGATGALLPPDVFAKSREDAAKLLAEESSYRAKVLRGVVQDHRSWVEAHEERTRMRRAWAAFFEEYDVVLCPAAASAAFPHDQKVERPDRTILVNGRRENYNDQLFWAGLASLVYLPATVAPAGLTPEGLPVGVQVVGPYLGDRTTIQFARLLAAEIGGFVPPPGYA
jgi:amidase